MGDRQATMDFAGFLLTLMDDILAGREVGERIALFPASDATGAGAVTCAQRCAICLSGPTALPTP